MLFFVSLKIYTYRIVWFQKGGGGGEIGNISMREGTDVVKDCTRLSIPFGESFLEGVVSSLFCLPSHFERHIMGSHCYWGC